MKILNKHLKLELPVYKAKKLLCKYLPKFGFDTGEFGRNMSRVKDNVSPRRAENVLSKVELAGFDTSLRVLS